MDIQQLKDFPSLEQLARSLWKPGEKGRAAVFVGAGLSRNARLVTEDTAKPPLWFELADRLASHLSPNYKSNGDQLRLAEEYRAYFGRSALETELRSMIADKLWSPTEVHTKLLALPWTDVLTTNYDSLLERAADEDIGRFYSLVRSEADLVHSPAPRIVKLHGTVGIDEQLVLTEEDYRHYPEQKAAFVNLARQIFIENDLCLVGFSGADPNFLQWSGWVRDRLGGGHRRIYLVGALDLSEPARTLLQERNIAPIDLGPMFDKKLPSDIRHRRAIETLIAFLVDSRPPPPHEWALGARGNPDFDRKAPAEDLKKLVREALKEVKEERSAYPGWLVCPSARRMQLRSFTSDLEDLFGFAWEHLDDSVRVDVVGELVWRFDTSFWQLSTWLGGACRELLAAEPSLLQDTQATALLASVMRSAREVADWETFDWSLNAAKTRFGNEMPVEVQYQVCLRARDELRYKDLESELKVLEALDPCWKLRAAALWAELGRDEEAVAALKEGLASARQSERLQPDSIWSRSRRAWAAWLLYHRSRRDGSQFIDRRQYDEWAKTDVYHECEPVDEVDYLRSTTWAELERYEDDRAGQFVPGFQPGTYSNRSKFERYVADTVLSPAQDVRRLSECAGVPMRSEFVNYLYMAEDAVALQDDKCPARYLELFRTQSNDTHRISRVALSRIRIAKTPVDFARPLFEQLIKHLDYSLKQGRDGAFSLRELRPWGKRESERCIRWMARLVVLLEQEEAISLVSSLAPLLVDNLNRNSSLRRAVVEATEGCAEVLNLSADSAVALRALEMPVVSTNSSQGDISLFSGLDLQESMRDVHEGRWKAAVRVLLNAAAIRDGHRAPAILRLTHLFDASLLTSDEEAEFGRALWAHVDTEEYPLPTGTQLHQFVLARLPAPPNRDAYRNVVQRVWMSLENIPADDEELVGLISALANPDRAVPPPPLTAFRLFRQAIVQLRDGPPKEEEERGLLRGKPAVEPSRYLGTLISALGEFLPPRSLSEELGREVLRSVGVNAYGDGLPSVVAFAEKHPALESQLTDLILRTIAKPEWRAKANAATAITAWLRRSTLRKRSARTTQRLLDALVLVLYSGPQLGMVDVLRNVKEIQQKVRLPKEQQEQLLTALATMLPFLSYSAHEAESRIASSISVMRALMIEIITSSKRVPLHLQPVFHAFRTACEEDRLPEVRKVIRDARQQDRRLEQEVVAKVSEAGRAIKVAT